ncbi:family 43 glycosylhydrolase [Wenyingzhuangia sp. 1_MG-2023]|nr:family 43 glycosylhydrolase [Wenyingzhuangia sp. 1_MG-2023]
MKTNSHLKTFSTRLFSIVFLGFIFSQCSPSKKNHVKQTTICNPINLSYRFALEGPSRREGADPTVVIYKGEYYLFASKSGGYWNSTDLIQWNFITSKSLPFEDYAPTAVVIKDTLYFMASNNKAPITIYKTTDPKSGIWQVANPNFPIAMTDPDLFYDNGRLFCYYGCSNKEPIYAVELNTKTLNPITKPVALFNSNKEDYGWERFGNYNEQPQRPWIEGAWMNKYKNKYYLQYAGPGTRFKSYSDGLYISDNPLGPFTLAEHNPISLKPEGFITGAGHGSTFKDLYGNYWHVATMVVTLKHKFERRLGIFPMFFDKDQTLYTYTGYGDYPLVVPQKKISSPDALFPQWMLLSYNKPVKVSSQLDSHRQQLAVDEEIRTYWSAKTGNLGEWFSIDLETPQDIYALQVNFAEHNTTLHDRNPFIYYQYLIEFSNDGKTWNSLIDKTASKIDAPHDYIQLEKPIKARYLKITNHHVPDGNFALSDFRVFGKGNGAAPSKQTTLKITRQEDKCIVSLKWQKIDDAVGYNIRYGSHPKKLYHNYQVLNNNSLTIRSLNKSQRYYFSIDSFNENGITKGQEITTVE